VDAVDLTPTAFAALVAPAIDRLYRGALHTVRDKGGYDLVTRLGRPALSPLVVLRTRLQWPDGVVSAAGLEAVHRYHDPQQWRANLVTSAEHGAVESTPDGGLRGTEHGRALLGELAEHTAGVTADLWSGEDRRVRRLVDNLALLLEAAAPTGGDAFAALTPPYEPSSAPASLRLLIRLGALRYHRADAHAAAWTEVGLTASEIAEMAPGAERDAVEAETNRRAAPPFAALDAPHRLEFLADLAALA
jgi:hypothetical protein